MLNSLARWARLRVQALALSLISRITEMSGTQMKDVRNQTGRQIQGWSLWGVLGNGADGIVYVCEKDGHQAAMKLFFPEQVQKNGLEAQTERLELQLTLRGGKHHPNLVEIYDGGFDQELGTLFLIMEYVPGTSLDKLVGKLPPASIPSLVRQLASAAQFLETKELFHRDIKPANIVVNDDFSKLTLLDLGVVFSAPTSGDERISRDEFVATVRYSPREFVWRDELGSDGDAWRAVTFYQIGATLHDMLAKKLLFEGFDTPRARLYDAVKLRPPVIDAPDCEAWLVQLAQCCLVKNWRERLQLLRWESFNGPATGSVDNSQRLQAIRLRQIRADEFRLLAEEERVDASKHTRAQELWSLQNSLFLEVRQFLMSAQVFPRFSGTHAAASETEYLLSYVIDADAALLFDCPVNVEIRLKAIQDSELTTQLSMCATCDAEEIFRATWTEMLTVETAATICQEALLQIADRIVAKT